MDSEESPMNFQTRIIEGFREEAFFVFRLSKNHLPTHTLKEKRKNRKKEKRKLSSQAGVEVKQGGTE